MCWWHPTPVLLPGKSHGWRSLVGCSPWGCKESDTTEWLHFHFPLSCIGEGNDNPLQCSCLGNPRDGGAWWTAVYGVAQSQTRLKRLSSSSSRLLRSCQLIVTRWLQVQASYSHNNIPKRRERMDGWESKKLASNWKLTFLYGISQGIIGKNHWSFHSWYRKLWFIF